MTDVCYMSDDDDDFMMNGSDSDEDDNGVAPTMSKKVLQETTNQTSSGTATTAKRTKGVEETYQKLTPHEVGTQTAHQGLGHVQKRDLQMTLYSHTPP
jgi:hypothetical protein